MMETELEWRKKFFHIKNEWNTRGGKSFSYGAWADGSLHSLESSDAFLVYLHCRDDDHACFPVCIRYICFHFAVESLKIFKKKIIKIVCKAFHHRKLFQSFIQRFILSAIFKVCKFNEIFRRSLQSCLFVIIFSSHVLLLLQYVTSSFISSHCLTFSLSPACVFAQICIEQPKKKFLNFPHTATWVSMKFSSSFLDRHVDSCYR